MIDSFSWGAFTLAMSGGFGFVQQQAAGENVGEHWLLSELHSTAEDSEDEQVWTDSGRSRYPG